MGRKFVPQSTLNRRMLRKDLRFQAEARRRIADQCRQPVVDVAIVPVPDQPVGPVVDVTLEPAEAHPFGEPVPGEAVDVPDRLDPCAGYTPRNLRGSWGRRMDGKPVRLPRSDLACHSQGRY
jgi:hypothetical protein